MGNRALKNLKKELIYERKHKHKHQSDRAESLKNGGSIPQMITKVGNTTYEVNIHFSKTSNETMTDKVLRLIRNEVISKG